MKKTLMLSALTLAIAGGVTGCANCSSCGDCDEVMEVEAMEVITCPACKQKIKCKKQHTHTKECKTTAACNEQSNDKDQSSTKAETADCGGCGREKDESSTKAETADCGGCGKENKDGQENQPKTTASVRKIK